MKKKKLFISLLKAVGRIIFEAITIIIGNINKK